MDGNKEEEKKEAQPETAEAVGKREEKKGIIEQVREEREKLEAVLEENKKVLADNQEVLARQMLSGKTSGGSEPVKAPEMTDKEYAEKALSGELNDVKKE